MTRSAAGALAAVSALLCTTSVTALTLLLPVGVPVPSSSGAGTKSLPLSAAFTRTPSTPDCLTNAFEMPGQAWHTDLTGGGIDVTGEVQDTRPPTFEGLYGFPATWLDARAANSELMVVDHFAFFPLKVRSPQGDQTLMLNHGALVEAHLRALLESAGFTLLSREPLRYGRGGRTLTLTRLDLGSEVYRTKGLNPDPADAVRSAALATALQQRLGTNGKSLVPRDLTLNMSFAMVPCEAMNVYRDNRQHWADSVPARRYNFNAFLQDAARASHLSLSEVQHELTDVPSTEPLRRTLTALSGERRSRGASFVAVASSGNFGLGYATAPGAFQDVISAGLYGWNRQPATDQDGQVWPDRADVNVAGEWFTLPAAQLQRFCQEGGTCVFQDVLEQPQRYATFSYRGTSFAAPTLSLFLALQQGPSNGCFTADGTGYAPIAKAGDPGTQGVFNFSRAWVNCEEKKQ